MTKIKPFVKEGLCAVGIVLWIFLLTFGLTIITDLSVQAKEDASAATGDMLVAGYTVSKGGNKKTGKIEQNYRVTVVADIKKDGITAAQAGKITATASSASFRIPKGGVAVEVVSGPDEPLALKLRLSDIVYKGTGDTLHFKLKYQSGGSDDGEFHVYECVETEKPFRKTSSSNDGDDKNKRQTHYGAPPLLISQTRGGKLLEPGEEFQVRVKVQNLSPRLTASDLMISLQPSDGMVLLGDSSTLYLRGLAAKQSDYITVKLRAAKELSTPSQSLGVSVKYNYFENDQRTAATAEEKLPLAFDPDLTGKSDVATPNVIISRYDYGERLAVGDTAELTLELQNTSPDVPVENLVMTLETGEGLTVVDSSNTFFIPSLDEGGAISRSVRIQALPTAQGAKPDYRVEVGFKYEFLAGAKRTPVTSSEKLGIPVYQPDRFHVSNPTIPEAVTAGEETTISFPYVNKGKGEVSNVEAELTGEVDALNGHQNLGNFEAGKSGSIDFVLTPQSAGETELQVKITYEDGNLKTKTLDFPVKLTVREPVLAVESMDEGMTEPPAPEYGWAVWAGAGLIILLLLALLIRNSRRKKRGRETCLALAWDDEESAVKTDETA